MSLGFQRDVPRCRDMQCHRVTLSEELLECDLRIGISSSYINGLYKVAARQFDGRVWVWVLTSMRGLNVVFPVNLIHNRGCGIELGRSQRGEQHQA